MRVVAVCVVALVFGFVGSMPLAGPDRGARWSRARRSGAFGEALRIGLGAAVAEGVYAGVAFWGFTTFLAQHAIVVPISTAATAVVLIGVGARFVFWRPDGEGGRRCAREPPGRLLLGFSVSAFNPTLLAHLERGGRVPLFEGARGTSRPLVRHPVRPCAATAASRVWFVGLVALLERYGGKPAARR